MTGCAHIDQRNTIESTEAELYINVEIVLSKGPNTLKEYSFQQIILGQLDIHMQNNYF